MSSPATILDSRGNPQTVMLDVVVEDGWNGSRRGFRRRLQWHPRRRLSCATGTRNDCGKGVLTAVEAVNRDIFDESGLDAEDQAQD